MSLFLKLPRARLAVLAGALLAGHAVMAQTIEDHSLPKSVIKTYHVKCSGGRLAMIRYDTRQEPAKVCVSRQDGGAPQHCTIIAKAMIDAQLPSLAQQSCQ